MDIVDAIIPAPNNAHNVVKLGIWDDLVPIETQGIAFDNRCVGHQGEKVEFHVDDILGFLHHLAFCDPKCRLRYGNCEIIDLDAIELSNRDVDRIANDAEHNLTASQLGDYCILQAPEAEIRLGQEIARTGSGIYLMVVFDTSPIYTSSPETARNGLFSGLFAIVAVCIRPLLS